jgi:hypothetical protein
MKNIQGLIYQPEHRSIVRTNGKRRMNRPFYCHKSVISFFAGECPEIYGPLGMGVFGYRRNDEMIGFSDFNSRKMSYRAGAMQWNLSDRRFPELEVILTVATPAEGDGVAIRVESRGQSLGDQLVFCLYPPGIIAENGGIKLLAKENAHWSIKDDHFNFGSKESPSTWEWHAVSLHSLQGKCSTPPIHWQPLDLKPFQHYPEQRSFAQLLESEKLQDPSHGIALTFSLNNQATHDFFLGVEDMGKTPSVIVDQALARCDAMENQVWVESPDPYLNAGVSVAAAAIFGCYSPLGFLHGGSDWRRFFLGWRSRGGATAYGWHDIVQETILESLRHQVLDSSHTNADSNESGTHYGPESRFYGVGYINHNQWMYNMQTQFFDEAVRFWWATGINDEPFLDALQKGLELHVQWQKDCFDPDDDGLYESCINCWPTDSVWYNGGGTVEESCYAYTARRALAQMLRLRGDTSQAVLHEAEAQKIQHAIHQRLWISTKGHYGAYIEQGGHQRLHEDAWIISEYLPVEARIGTPLQDWQALYYTERTMETYDIPGGGELRQTSNWVPSHWSVREWYAGDNYALALAYFQAGLGDKGYRLLQGNLVESMYGLECDHREGRLYSVNLKSPGGLSKTNGGIDFNDLSTMFARAVVEGLFGYSPNYPNHQVNFHPAFPSDWSDASIKSPDFSLRYQSLGLVEIYDVELAQSAGISLRCPLRAEGVSHVDVNGRRVDFELVPWAGYTMLMLNTEPLTAAHIAITTTSCREQQSPLRLKANVGERVHIQIPDSRVHIVDPQTCLSEIQMNDGFFTGRVTGAPGHRMLFVEVQAQAPYYQCVELDVEDIVAEEAAAGKTLRTCPSDAQWLPVDLSRHFNGALQDIFKQRYLTPRSKTISCRLGFDGWSAWTFPYWKLPTPQPKLDNLVNIEHSNDLLVTAAGARFASPKEDLNISFTSLWDNWPDKVVVPVHRTGKAAWLMISGTTNPMQGKIANAVIRFRYQDGFEEKLELVPPDNYWSLCRFATTDYDVTLDKFALPETPPQFLQLGTDCRAMVYGWKLRPDMQLESITLETLSQEVIVGLMAISIMSESCPGAL